MKELKLKPSTQIKVLMPDGEAIIIRRPKVIEAERLEEDTKKDGVKAIYAFLAAVGLPTEKAKELEMDQLSQVVEVLLPEKKP